MFTCMLTIELHFQLECSYWILTVLLVLLMSLDVSSLLLIDHFTNNFPELFSIDNNCSPLDRTLSSFLLINHFTNNFPELFSMDNHCSPLNRTLIPKCEFPAFHAVIYRFEAYIRKLQRTRDSMSRFVLLN